MAGLQRTVHLTTDFSFGSIDTFAPDLQVRQQAENGGEPVAPPALCFTDPDGERHVFVFSEDGRKALIAQLTGGIIIPANGRVG